MIKTNMLIKKIKIIKKQLSLNYSFKTLRLAA